MMSVIGSLATRVSATVTLGVDDGGGRRSAGRRERRKDGGGRGHDGVLLGLWWLEGDDDRGATPGAVVAMAAWACAIILAG